MLAVPWKTTPPRSAPGAAAIGPTAFRRAASCTKKIRPTKAAISSRNRPPMMPTNTRAPRASEAAAVCRSGAEELVMAVVSGGPRSFAGRAAFAARAVCRLDRAGCLGAHHHALVVLVIADQPGEAVLLLGTHLHCFRGANEVGIDVTAQVAAESPVRRFPQRGVLDPLVVLEARAGERVAPVH